MAPAHGGGQGDGASRRSALIQPLELRIPLLHVLRTPLLPVFLAGAALLGMPAHGEQRAAKEPELIRAVSLFKVLCLGQLPDLDGVATAAGLGEFAPGSQEEIEKYGADASADLRVWRFHDASGEYVLSAGKSPADAALVKDTPKLAGKTGTACALHLPPGESAEAVAASLKTLLSRPPDGTWQDGGSRISAWNKVTGNNFSQVRFYAPEQKGLSGLLRAAIFVLN